MRILLFYVLIFINSLALAAPIVIVVGPVTDVDCQFNTIQAAIDSGAINMNIRVSNQLTTVDGISLFDKDVTLIRGGYGSCQDALDGIVDMNNPYSAISNNNGDGVTIDYSVKAVHIIDFVGFIIDQSQRGISIIGSGLNQSLTVNFVGVNISNNSSTGLKTKGSNVVVNFNNGEIDHNVGAEFGGGVRCFLSEMNFGELTAIHHNSADFGGGASINKCTMTFLAGDSNELNLLQYGIFSNMAAFSGGGLFVDKSSLGLYGTVLHPVSVVNNDIPSGNGSPGKGGGIYVGRDSIVIMGNIRIESNTAKSLGGGIYATFSSASAVNPAVMQIGTLQDGCSYSDICNSISFNQTLFGEGGAVYLTGGVNLTVAQTMINANTALHPDANIFKVKGGSQLGLLSSLIINNSTSSSDLINQEDGSSVFLQLDTLAENQVGNYFNLLYDNSTAQLLEVKDSILMNDMATIANLNNDMGDHDAQVKCSLVESDDASGVVQNQSQIGAASFFEPSDYRLLNGSLGLGSNCTTIGEFDLSRYDIVNNDRLTSPSPDLGAYQMGYLFDDGFE